MTMSMQLRDVPLAPLPPPSLTERFLTRLVNGLIWLLRGECTTAVEESYGHAGPYTQPAGWGFKESVHELEMSMEHVVTRWSRPWIKPQSQWNAYIRVKDPPRYSSLDPAEPGVMDLGIYQLTLLDVGGPTEAIQEYRDRVTEFRAQWAGMRS